MFNLANFRRLTGTSLIAVLMAGTLGVQPGNTGGFKFTDFKFRRAADDPTKFHTKNYPDGTGVEAFQQFVQAERVAVSIEELNARKLDPTKLKLKEDHKVKIYFIDEGAGYRNQLYLDTIDASGKDGMIFYDGSRGNGSNQLRKGDYVKLGEIPAGATLDFHLRKNGYGKSNPDIWYADITRNSDNTQHVMAFEYEGYLILAWEDLTGGGDKDYNDIVFAVDIGAKNLANIPSSPDTNEAPIAEDDSVKTPLNTSVTIDVLDNDSDPENQSLNLDSVDDLLSTGTVAKSGNQVIYTPESDFTGTDSFVYTISDSQGVTDTATVTVNVEGIQDTCSVADSVTLTGTVRDFLDTHPDFQYKIGNDRDMVTTELGSDRKPVYAHPDGSTKTTNGKQYFDQWYRDVNGVNTKKTYDITLQKQPNGLYRYQNTSFFPIDGELQGNQGRSHNYHFTYELHGQFTYKGGEVLNFSGDDDVWVYINGKRVIDLGGVHSKQDANVNIDNIASSLGIEVGQTYDFDFFFAERHTTQSNFILETSIGMLCDTDDDGISDVVESTNDTDGDGTPDFQDPDSDDDGIPDELEGTEDIDGDGTPDFQDDDSDNNGIPDYEDSQGDNDGDGIRDYQDPDDDGDGIDDINDDDTDGDGIDDRDEYPDFPEDFFFPNDGTPDDVDGDGVINEVDPDGDGNGVLDKEENLGDYGYGTPPLDPNNLPDGLPDDATIDDLDGDEIPNGLDTNDDGDDMPDIPELEYWEEYTPETPPTSGGGNPEPGKPDMFYD